MTLCMASSCRHEGRDAIVLCADWQGTRGDSLKAEDTYKLRHFTDATVLISGDMDAGAEFAAQFEEITREINSTPKPKGEFDLRVGVYLSSMRTAVAPQKQKRANSLLQRKYAISLSEFYQPDTPQKLQQHQHDEIFEAVKKTGLGAAFIFAYIGEEEPFLVHIDEDGEVSWEEAETIAIGSGEPIASAILAQWETEGEPMGLVECTVKLYLAKSAAQANPYVGSATTLVAMMPGNVRHEFSREFWDYLKRLPPPVPYPDLGKWEKRKVPILGEQYTP